MGATAPRHGMKPLTGKKGKNPCFQGKFASLVGGARVGGDRISGVLASDTISKKSAFLHDF